MAPLLTPVNVSACHNLNKSNGANLSAEARAQEGTWCGNGSQTCVRVSALLTPMLCSVCKGKKKKHAHVGPRKLAPSDA